MTRNLILIAPGLIARNETTRLESYIQPTENTRIVRVNYSQVKRDKSTIYCGGKIEDYAEDFTKTLESKIKENESLGLITSSFGTAVFVYALPHIKKIPKWIISISPLTKLNPKLLEIAIQNSSQQRFILSNNNDQKNGITRIIMEKSIPELFKIDCNKYLEQNQIQERISALTFIGEQDLIGCPDSMKEYHEQLGGKKRDLIILPEKHDIPHEAVIPDIKRFLEPMHLQ